MQGWFKHIFFLLLFGIFSGVGKAQVSAPSLRCISVDGSEITLDWVVSNDAGGQFTRYEIMLSVGGAPYVNVANLNNRLQNTFTHTNANFGVATTDYKYYIIAQYNDGSVKYTSSSDTLSPIVPNLTVNVNVSGQLRWNPIHTPKLASSNNKYEVDRRFNSTPPNWSTGIANPDVDTEQFNDQVARCNDEVFYKIRLGDASGCESVSAEVSSPLVKVSGPAPMTFRSISVNKDFGYTELFWNTHPEPETVGYLIFYVDANGNERIIDTVSSNTLTYKDLNANRPAILASQCYRIAAIDSCGLTQGAVSTHCTMYLTRTFDPCEGEVSLTWTPYEGWANGVSKYEVYMSENNGPFIMKGEIQGSDTSYMIGNISAINSYAFYVVATDGSGSEISNSNLLGTKFQFADKPSFIRLRSASIVSADSIEVRMLADRKAPFKRIELYRSHSEEGPFKHIRNYIPPNAVDSYLVVHDTQLLEGQLQAFYYAIIVDECDKPIVKSGVVRTIFLEARGDKYSFETDLDWSNALFTDTSRELQPVYFAYYGTNGALNDDFILSTKEVTAYKHQFEADAISSDEFCYQVKLVQQPTLTYGRPDTSYSNMECFSFEPEFEIPTAFTPNTDGLNEIWKPEIIYGEAGTSYQLDVYDQWGKIIFQSSDPNAGWDGQIDGRQAPVGSYIYKLKVITFRGSAINSQGYFSLIR